MSTLARGKRPTKRQEPEPEEQEEATEATEETEVAEGNADSDEEHEFIDVKVFNAEIAPRLSKIIDAAEQAGMPQTITVEFNGDTWATQLTVKGGRPQVFLSTEAAKRADGNRRIGFRGKEE